jgi:hypothetical protein
MIAITTSNSISVKPEVEVGRAVPAAPRAAGSGGPALPAPGLWEVPLASRPCSVTMNLGAVAADVSRRTIRNTGSWKFLVPADLLTGDELRRRAGFRPAGSPDLSPAKCQAMESRPRNEQECLPTSSVYCKG